MSKRALRRILFCCLVLFGFSPVLLSAILLQNPRVVVETALALALGRSVTIGALQIEWGATIALHLRELTIASSADLPADALVSVGTIDAALDGAQMLGGTLAFRALTIDKAVLILARDSQGRGNWRFAPNKTFRAEKNRTQIPDLGDFALTNGTVRYRTSSGHWLVVELDDMHMRTDGSAGRVAIELGGSYQHHKATLAISAGSFDALRDATQPYPMSLQLAAPQLLLAFDGTFVDPLDFDGAVGHLKFAADRLGALQAFFDADATIAAALTLEESASRQGDVWNLAAAHGRLAEIPVHAKHLTLLEGARGGSDTLTADVAFGDLDLKAILAREKFRGDGFRPDPDADGLRTDLRIAVASLRYDKVEFLRGVRLIAVGGPGTLALRDGVASFGGGALAFNGHVQAVGVRDSDLQLQMRLKGAQTEMLAAFVVGSDDGPAPVRGRLDAAFDLRMSGNNIATSLQNGQMMLVIALQNGTIDRALVEAASTDLRATFRRSDATMVLECVFGVATLKDGIGAIGPVRLRAADGSFVAAGSFDPSHRAVDILVLSDPAASGSMALDTPLRLQWALGRLTVVPAPGSRFEPPTAPQAAANLALGNPCR